MADIDSEAVIDSLREVYKAQAKGESQDEPKASTGKSESKKADTEPEDSSPVQDAEANEEFEEVSLEGADEDELEAAADEDQEDAEPEEVFQPPEHWSSDEKEAFKSLTPEGQQLLLNKKRQFQQGYQERAQSISNIEKALEPYKQSLAYMGVDEATAIRTLFATQQRVMQDPANGILALAQQFGVMDQLRQQFAPDTDDEFVDPEIKALRQQVQELKTGLGNFQQQTVQQQQQDLLSQIDSFKSQTDGKGQLAHPYFDQVRHNMAPLVQQGKSMEEAYNEAVWLVPEYREKHLKTVANKRQSETQQDRAKRVKQAKRAATTNKSSSKTRADDPESRSVAEELRVAWNQLS